ncbi:transketolase family protein [Actinomadura nitritigenes]|uniref:transketolase family protein n=1 Tax=Actinomadura nitritigenes TaxID=134602 RepID=UPI003D8AD55E
MRAKTDLRDPGSFDHVGRDRGARFVAGRVLADLADADDRIVAGAADLTHVTQMGTFQERHPERYLQFGISERHMYSAAAGLATCGLIPYMATFASFSGILAYENIRTDHAYPRLPVRIVATHAGISMGFFGTSHHATEDIAALRAVAGLTVLSPSDPASTEALLRATVDVPGPVYFRLGRGREEDVYTGGVPEGFAPGGPHLPREGTDLLLIGTGVMVRECMRAADELAARGVEVTVADAHTLKPFPAERVAELAAAHPAVLTVEEHNIEGGLGTMVVEALAAHGVPVPVHKHGLRDEYGIVGPPTHLYRYYGLDAAGVATVAGRFGEAVAAGNGRAAAREPIWSDADRDRVLTATRAQHTR